MRLYEAKVADILRCSQKDEFIIEIIQGYVSEFFKLSSKRLFYRNQEIIHKISSSLYYLLTSLSNLQTLGEEYSGIIRIDRNKQIPSRLNHIIWLVLCIGGDSLLERFLNLLQKKVSASESLTHEAKTKLLKYICFLKENKYLLIKLHQALFYINGDYYYISNHLTGIRYILLRQWLQDDTSTQSFKLLGKILLIYLAVHLLYQPNNFSTGSSVNDIQTASDQKNYNKLCLICTENRKNTTATFCGHLFCWSCIQDSLSYQQTCPVCREPVSCSRIISLQNYD